MLQLLLLAYLAAAFSAEIYITSLKSYQTDLESLWAHQGWKLKRWARTDTAPLLLFSYHRFPLRGWFHYPYTPGDGLVPSASITTACV